MGFQEIVDYKNLLHWGLKCCNNGRWKYKTQLFEINLLQRTSGNKELLISKKFNFGKTHDFTICERGKQRRIKAHTIDDRQIQKSFCQEEMIPAVQNRILPNNSASQKNKGTDYAIKKFRAGLAHAYKVCNGMDFYVIIYDFHDYFGSIPHDKCIDSICKNLSDDDSREIFKLYTAMFPGDAGYGIGGELSQVVAIAYPSSLDRMLVCDKRVIASGSGRYMDDGHVIVRTKEDAHAIVELIIQRAAKLGLNLNEKRLNIYWMKKDIVIFLKKRTSMTDSGKIIMRLVRKNIRNALRSIKYYKKQYDANLINMGPIMQFIQCWLAYSRPYNSYKARIKVADTFCKTFDVPWEEVRKLL